MKNTKYFRWLVGGVLAVVFPVQFLLMGMANAELLNKDIPNSYTYKTDTLKNLRQMNLGSFLGKPVKIPFVGDNPDGVPGADQDLAIIFPPRILDKNASVPLRAMYLSSGKAVSTENVAFANKLELLVNSVGSNNSAMLEIIKNIIESNQKISFNTDNCSSLACYLPAVLKLARAQTTTESTSTDTGNTSALLTQDDLSQLADSLKDMDTSNPQVKQLLTLVLLLMANNGSMAQSLNTDKQDCLDMGGEWTNGACQSEEKRTCEENGGTYKKLLNSCVKDKLTCGNEDLDCSSEQEVDDSDNALSVYGCACKSGSCLDDNGNCIGQNNSKKKVCTKSGGTWQMFSDPSELCLQKCDATSASCSNASFSSSSSSISSSSTKAQMGCDCSSANANTNVNWAQTGTSTSPPKMCLSAEGSCTAKDTCKDDDDKDGVLNCQDKCANSTPDGSGTVNMTAGGQDQGCTCSQIQAAGRAPKQQQTQCPPDGCEEGTPYMVQYDRSQQNNQQQQAPQCQNGIFQQQQQQQIQVSQYGTTGTYSSCPVLSRQPTQQCQDDMDRRNENKNKANDMLKDLLDKMKNDKKNQDQKNGGNQNNPGNNNPGNNNTTPQPNQNDNKKKEEDDKKPGISAATDPKGVGPYNAGRTGTEKDPYALHASQFKKICGENTYELFTAAPGPKDSNFKDDPKKAGEITPGKSSVDELGIAINKLKSTCTQCTGTHEVLDKFFHEIKGQWSKLDQAQQDTIKKILDPSSGGNAADKYDKAKQAFDQAIKDNQTKTQQAQQAAAQSTSKLAKSMKELDEPNAFFKIPTCAELAKTHCCVCSCCDKPDKQCGWAIGMKCNTTGDKGTCEGEKCATAPTKCSEKDPKLSIKLDWGADFKQCSNNNGDKASTSQEKCGKYTPPIHNEGACRYDCTGSDEGCEKGSDSCKIIIKGHEIQLFNRGENPDVRLQPTGNAKFIIFTNKKEGSLVQSTGNGPTKDDWVQNLKKDVGEACKCKPDDKGTNPNPQYPDGYVPPAPGQTSPTPPTGTQQPGGGILPPDRLIEIQNQKPPLVSVPSGTGVIPDDQRRKLQTQNDEAERNFYRDYDWNKSIRGEKPTFEGFQDWKEYQKYKDDLWKVSKYDWLFAPSFGGWQISKYGKTR
jgi:hypothetical protein